jgi:hypothetical protein
VSLWSVSCLVVAARIGLAGTGWSSVGSARLPRGSTADLGRRFAGAQAAAPRSPLTDQGSWSSARCWSVGGGAGKEQVLPSPPQVRPGQVVGVMADMRLDREVVTTLRGRCAGVGPVSSGAGGPIRFGGEQAAAALRPR